jgi:effector-binding domain-containing protein
MANGVVVRELGPRTIAYRHEHGSFVRIPDTLEELLAWLAERGLEATGPVGAHFFNDPQRTPEEHYDWEVFVELSGPAPATGAGARFGVRRMPSALMAAVVHRGPHATVAEAYEALHDWIASHDYRMAGPSEEIYLSEPGTPPDDLVTEVRVPVARPH